MSRGSNDPPYGGHVDPNHEEIWEQTGALDPDWSAEAAGAPERRSGDVLSDGWGPDAEDGAKSGSEPAIETGVHMALDPRMLENEREWTEGERWSPESGRPEAALQGSGEENPAGETGEWGRPADIDDWDRAATTGEDSTTSGTGDGAFLGAGWRNSDEQDEEERPRRGKMLLLATAAAVVTATAGGWLLFSSLGDSGEACPSGSNCTSVGRSDPLPTGVDATTEEPLDEAEETEEPEEIDDSEPEATPTASLTPRPVSSIQQGRPEAVPETSRPSATREPEPRPTRETQEPEKRPERDRPTTSEPKNDNDIKPPENDNSFPDEPIDTRRPDPDERITEIPTTPEEPEEKNCGLFGWFC
ncbi:hypothetical protein [Thermostaphylospora chromogena]|uniref:Uncharacterized protein n=1 Tax=Thermostaphylospora chromogena TaxID=35622 RepID=A0A1H1GHN1_9ACTN|nr:hypothetical protein [Thermostaphylospora chromogena]SDR12408.1 hypothetical protein SAMN04489764_3583 [Thermostaphylospora chromogena]